MSKISTYYQLKYCLWLALLVTSFSIFSCIKNQINDQNIELVVNKELDFNDIEATLIYDNMGNWIVSNGVINSHFQIYEIYQGILVDIDLDEHSYFEYDKVGNGPGEYQRAMFSSFKDSNLYIADQNGKLIIQNIEADTLVNEVSIAPTPMSFSIYRDEFFINHLIKNDYIFIYDIFNYSIKDSIKMFHLELGNKNILAEWGRISAFNNMVVFIPTYLDHIWLYSFATQSWQKQKYPFGVSHKTAIESGSGDMNEIKRPDIKNSYALANIALLNHNCLVLNNFKRVDKNEPTTVFLSVFSSDMDYKGSVKINGSLTKGFVATDTGRIAWVTTDGVYISNESLIDL